ncbi:class 3-domain-containing protein [Cokeromyces recurvatus]|uniref:class 3-domain-containing protein n=1 Tax=Cokeromyces recurvatus TaxID=90255 RepID=UPI002220EC43|nr:class 3-domain-containing protein [Cokeromyces recurvatus]KAI7905651.1 class 3-domain-containing protein [Cokeromyces recurvatus]
MFLLLSDQVIRVIMGQFIGQHASKRYLSMINACDSRFFKSPHEELINDTIKEKKEQTPQLVDESDGQKSNTNFKRPEYSLSVAHTLSVASKLAYEDVAVVKYELEKAGFLVEKTFKPIGYKNACAYIIEKDNDIMLVFRGTNPLNIQNYVTNIDAGLANIMSSKNHSMGKVHKGFWDAMGATEAIEIQGNNTSISSIHVDLSHVSFYKSISTAFLGIIRILKALSFNIFANVIDPIDASWAGYDSAIIRHQSLYSQSEKYILELFKSMNDDEGKKKLYITGHSLGGALATVFVAKMIQTDSVLLDYFAGLYTYGQPNIGDKDFSKSFSSDITCKIFNHVYNNDVIPRIPPWYSPPPGTLVFIDSSYKISIYPPNQLTQDPVPMRSISYLHLSGLLNKHVIRRLKSESALRVLFRILLPFFLNDHFPSDYCDALLMGDVEWIILGENEGGTDYVDDRYNKKGLKKI